eukprot:Nk52_evm94s1444 gene=Nk52_evmTU94s1444
MGCGNFVLAQGSAMGAYLVRLSKRRELVQKAAVGIIFVLLNSILPLLIAKSKNQDENYYKYAPVTVTLLSESLKFTVSLALALHTYRKDPGSCNFSIKSFWHFGVPGLFYFIDNNIRYIVLLHFNPAMANLMGHFTIITTALLFRYMLKRYISNIQWASLIILLAGILMTQATVFQSEAGGSNTGHRNTSMEGESENVSETLIPEQKGIHFSWGHLLILIQCLCASIASCYNEKIMKQKFSDSIHFQNAQLYFFGMVFNFLALFLHGHWERITTYGFFNGYTVVTFLIILDAAMLGLSVSLILKFVDNMFHVFASSVAVITVSILSIWFLDFQPSSLFWLGCLIVCCSIYIYNADVANHPQPEKVRYSSLHSVRSNMGPFSESALDDDSSSVGERRRSSLLERDSFILKLDGSDNMPEHRMSSSRNSIPMRSLNSSAVYDNM